MAMAQKLNFTTFFFHMIICIKKISIHNDLILHLFKMSCVYESWGVGNLVTRLNDALLSSLLDPLEGLSMLNCGKLELGAALDFQH